MEFNSSPGDQMELSPLFSDDSYVAGAASIVQKLRKMASLFCKFIFSHIFMSQLFIGLHKHDGVHVLSKLKQPFVNYSWIILVRPFSTKAKKNVKIFFFNEFSSMSKAVLSEGCLGGR